MDPVTLIVAIVAAVGVIVSALLQRKTNADTLRAAERRESDLRADARQQREDERAEAQLRALLDEASRESELERARVASEVARRREHQDHWREFRLHAHTKGLRSIDMLVSAAAAGWSDRTPEEFSEALSTVSDAYPDIALFASRASLEAFEKARKVADELRRLETRRSLDEFYRSETERHQKPTPLFGEVDEWRAARDRLVTAQADYRVKAKEDLGTND